MGGLFSSFTKVSGQALLKFNKSEWTGSAQVLLKLKTGVPQVLQKLMEELFSSFKKVNGQALLQFYKS